MGDGKVNIQEDKQEGRKVETGVVEDRNQRFPQCAFDLSWLWLDISVSTKKCLHLMIN